MLKKDNTTVDVLVIGDGIAGCAAALAARKEKATVVMIEKAKPNGPHGNTAFCGGALRRVSKEYPAKRYFADIMKVSEGQANPLLTKITIQSSKAAKTWLGKLGVRWTAPASNPGRADSVVGKGPALASVLRNAVGKANIPVHYRTRALSIDASHRGHMVVKARNKNGLEQIACRAVIIATGGFQGNRKMASRYLGKGAERLVLRGYTGNTGDGHMMVERLGARLIGMEGYHGGVIHSGYKQYPRVSAKTGMRSVKRYEKTILVNRNGSRFVDEGEDTADKTYAKFGRIIALTQPGGIAYLIFDSAEKDTVDPMYYGPGRRAVSSSTIKGLAKKLSINPTRLQETVDAFNSAVQDGRALTLSPPKTNFAVPIDKPPFYAYRVTGGMTFTFGGVEINEKSEVKAKKSLIPGVYAAGEVTGGFFFHNYPAGSSLTRCAVFGQIAGRNAARYALESQ